MRNLLSSLVFSRNGENGNGARIVYFKHTIRYTRKEGDRSRNNNKVPNSRARWFRHIYEHFGKLHEFSPLTSHDVQAHKTMGNSRYRRNAENFLGSHEKSQKMLDFGRKTPQIVIISMNRETRREGELKSRIEDHHAWR